MVMPVLVHVTDGFILSTLIILLAVFTIALLVLIAHLLNENNKK
jgi:hypothetical protein